MGFGCGAPGPDRFGGVGAETVRWQLPSGLPFRMTVRGQAAEAPSPPPTRRDSQPEPAPAGAARAQQRGRVPCAARVYQTKLPAHYAFGLFCPFLFLFRPSLLRLGGGCFACACAGPLRTCLALPSAAVSCSGGDSFSDFCQSGSLRPLRVPGTSWTTDFASCLACRPDCALRWL